MILVTGGTGLVGSHLLYFLLQENDEVLAIYRTASTIESVKKVFSFYTSKVDKYFSKIKWLQADITDIPSLEIVFASKNIRQVYHCAALISFNPKDYRKMRQVNIDGTANLVNFSIDQKVEKFCFVSSIAALGDNIKNKPIDEETEWNTEIKKSGYSITKRGAEMEVWRASQEGIDVIILNPGVILGGGFFNKGSGKIFSQIYNGFKFYTDGVTGFVGIKDVVKSMIILMNSNLKNEGFILVSENKSFKDVFFAIADSFGKKRPTIRIGKLITAIFWRVDWFLTKITRKTPLLTKYTAQSTHKKEYYSSEKIKKNIAIEFDDICKVIDSTCKQYLI